MFEQERLLDLLQANRSCTAEEVLSAALTGIRAFTDDAPQFDDLTMIILKRTD